MVIDIPSRLVPLEAVNFSKYLNSCNSDSEFLYNFGNMQHCHPFGLLVVASAIRSNIAKYPEAIHKPINVNDTQGCQFAASFGFFTSIGFDIGVCKDESEIGDRYIPIKSINRSELNAKYSDIDLLNEKIVRHAGELSEMLVAHNSKEVKYALQYCFREIIRNTFEHAETDSLWVCGQYWPSRGEAEIAILDEGIGILESLRPNPNINVHTCQEANSLALQPGLSRTLGVKQEQYNLWQNSGYGLYVASTLCAMSNGYFLIDSGDSCVLVNNNGQTNYESSQNGTAICLNLKTKSNQLRNFSRTLDVIVEEGERKANENGQTRILSASKVTTIASMIRHIENTVREQKIYDIVDAKNGQVPLNTRVTFSAISVNTRGEIYGTFEYDGKVFEGLLLDVDRVNRSFYVKNKKTIIAIVRKIRNNKYILLEPHRYKRLRAKSKSKQ